MARESRAPLTHSDPLGLDPALAHYYGAVDSGFSDLLGGIEAVNGGYDFTGKNVLGGYDGLVQLDSTHYLLDGEVHEQTAEPGTELAVGPVPLSNAQRVYGAGAEAVEETDQIDVQPASGTLGDVHGPKFVDTVVNANLPSGIVVAGHQYPAGRVVAGPVGAIVELLDNGGMRVVKKLWTKAEAVAARHAGKDVKMFSKQMAKEVQRAAAHGQGVVEDGAHILKAGGRGSPHFHPADRGVGGHTFWGKLKTLIGGITLGKILDGAVDVFQPPIDGELSGSCVDEGIGCD